MLGPRKPAENFRFSPPVAKTGLTLNAGLSAGFKLSDAITGSAGVLFPVYTKTYSDGGDAYDPAPVFSISIAKQF